MKRELQLLLFLLPSLFGRAQASYSVCPGGVSTISITNSWNLSHVSYSLNPGAVTFPNGIWTVTVNTPGTYMMYITGDDQSAVQVTYSTSVNIGHFPAPNLATVSSP